MQEQMYNHIKPPKAYRRATGAHAILTSLLFADLFGLLFVLLIGAYISAPLRWVLLATLDLLHNSLLLDIALLLILLSLFIGWIRMVLMEKKAEEAFAEPIVLIAIIVFVMLILLLVKAPFLAFPAPLLPRGNAGPFPVSLQFDSTFAAGAAGLYLLAHYLAFRFYQRTGPPSTLSSYARAHRDGTWWSIVEQCYPNYRRGLDRYKPPLIEDFKTPPTFLYYVPQHPQENPEYHIYWVGDSLVISQMLLDSKKVVPLLLPLLARVLHDYNSPNLRVEQLLQLATLAKRKWLARFLLFFPLWVASSCEKRWSALERDRGLDKDRFAYLCGQGTRLRRLLRSILEQQLANGELDHAVPTLTERIEHLDSLIEPETRQVEQLRAALPPASPAEE